MSKILWLSYAWKDNTGRDVDFVIQELQKAGLDVRYDRVEVVAGQRLWTQIDKAIREKADGWALYATLESLKSEPCQEEIAYALDRALREGPKGFPLFGIFPRSLDRALVPSGLATRLHVDLKDPQWAERIAEGLSGRALDAAIEPVLPFVATKHIVLGKAVVELRPRAGRWFPFFAAVGTDQSSQIEDVWFAPSGHPHPFTGMLASGDVSYTNDQGRTFAGREIHHAIDPQTSAYVRLSAGEPDLLVFGPVEGERYFLAEAPHLRP